MRWLWILLSVLLLLGVAVTRFYPTLVVVEVVGNQHRSAAEVMQTANVAPGDPTLWITRWRVRRLLEDPWLLQAQVVRWWPDRASIVVVERTPVLAWEGVAYAADGTALPGYPEAELAQLPQLQGLGPSRLEEALMLLDMLRERQVRVIVYGPEGFDLDLTDVQVYTPSVDVLRSHWSAFQSQRGGRVAVYPWGVSNAP
jgi:cell division protein FtsQ